MHIEHIAIWARDLEKLREFYCRNFGARSGPKYRNPGTGFESHFLSFDSGCRLELMQMPGIQADGCDVMLQRTGLIHLALKLGSAQAVREKTETLRAHGVRVVSEPRTTGDGYYESCVLDPEGNRIELVA